jgi:chromosomal replication initiator protein
MEKILKELRAALKKRIPAHSFHMWIEPLDLQSPSEGHWQVICPNAFSRKRVQDHFGELLSAELRRITSEPECRVEYLVTGRRNNRRESLEPSRQLVLPSETIRPNNGRFLRRDFTFEHFVVGSSNDFAYSASLSLASRRDCPQPALFLYSNTGLGKSHLSQAIGHHVLNRNPEERVYYMTAEDFSNEMVQSFQQDTFEKFKAKYRNHCDVLLLEDVHCLSGKKRTQTELATTLDMLYESGKRIIFSSSHRPSEIPKLQDKLRSRFSSSLISAIEPPSFRTRLRILQVKAGLLGYTMPPAVLDYLATELVDDVRQLESGLSSVAAKSSLLGAPIDLALAESVVKHIAAQQQKITVELIKKLVCMHYNISSEDLTSRSRKQKYLRPRQMAIYLSRRFTDSPLQSIGKSFNRYHATALHSIQSIEKGIKEDSSVQEQVDFFRKKLELGKP